MTDADAQYVRRSAPRLTPERVRSIEFTRTAIGRRGVNEEEVQAFLQRVADDIAARDAAEATLRSEVGFYKDRLLQRQREAAGPGGPEAAAAAPAPVQPTIEAVNILSQAQQEADAYVAQARDYCRRMTDDARVHAEAILTDAKTDAEQAAEEAVHTYRAEAGDTYAAEFEELERRLAWARTFLASLETVETQLRTTREALTYEVDKIVPPGAPPTTPSPSRAPAAAQLPAGDPPVA